MDGELVIRQSVVQLSACCRSPLMITNVTEGDLCACCREKWHGMTPWYTEDGLMMFELISDLRSVG